MFLSFSGEEMTVNVFGESKASELQIVKLAYFKSFIGCFLIVVIGLCVSYTINTYYPLDERMIGLVQAFSVVPGSATLFGAQTWNIQAWSATSPAEVLNQKLFRCFSAIGLFVAVVAFSLFPPAAPA